jgi:CheY-like chemotaxis protein
MNSINILVADDDSDDRLLTKEAFQENRLKNPIFFVEDGEQLMNFLKHRNGYNAQNAPRPGLILLDLNMPKLDGREALAEIKSDPKLKSIPVIILTTSKREEDIIKSYDLGVNSFITKPVSFNDLVEVTARIKNYWFELVKLPKDN